MILQKNNNNDLDSQNQFKRELSNDSHRKYHKQNVTTTHINRVLMLFNLHRKTESNHRKYHNFSRCC